VNVAQRRRRSQIHQEEGRNLRAAVEATVRQVKHPFPGGKLPVRGQFRVTCTILGIGDYGQYSAYTALPKGKTTARDRRKKKKRTNKNPNGHGTDCP